MLMNLHNSKYDVENSFRSPFRLQPQIIVSANGHIETLWWGTRMIIWKSSCWSLGYRSIIPSLPVFALDVMQLGCLLWSPRSCHLHKLHASLEGGCIIQ